MAETLFECALFLLALQILLTEARPIKSMNTFLHQSNSANNVQESITGVKIVGPAKPVTVGHNSTEVGRTINVYQSKSSGFGATASAKDDFRPIAPGYSPGVSHPKKPAAMASSNVIEHSIKGVKVVYNSTDISLKISLHQSKSSGFDATASAKDDFRPTAPGYSPSIGHPKTPSAITSSNVVEHSVTGVKAFHSSTKIGRTTKLHQSKSSGFYAIASAKDDFRPNTPGYSPGVGYPKKPAVVTSSDVEHSVTRFKDKYQPTQSGNSPGVGH